MSTKDSIAYKHNTFHLDYELFDEEHIYFELTGAAFQATPERIRVRIPLEIWAVIRSRAAVRLPWAERPDAEIRSHVEREVDERIEKALAGTYWIFGSFIYGAADQPREEQVRRGMKHYRQVRDRHSRIAQAIQAMEAEQRTRRTTRASGSRRGHLKRRRTIVLTRCTSRNSNSIGRLRHQG